MPTPPRRLRKADPELPVLSQIIAAGPGRQTMTGQLIPMHVAVGDFVKFRDYAGSEIRIQGVEYIVVRASDCLAKWA